MSYSVYITEEGILNKKNKRILHFQGVNFGVSLEIVEESDKAVLVFEKGHSSYVNRMEGSKYYSPSYHVFLYTIPQKEVVNFMDLGGEEITYQGKSKEVKANALFRARALFERANRGEFGIPKPEPKALRDGWKETIKDPRPNKLGKRLWSILSGVQENASFGEGIEFSSDKDVLRLAKSALNGHVRCVKLLKKFIEENS